MPPGLAGGRIPSPEWRRRRRRAHPTLPKLSLPLAGQDEQRKRKRAGTRPAPRPSNGQQPQSSLRGFLSHCSISFWARAILLKYSICSARSFALVSAARAFSASSRASVAAWAARDT